MKWINDNLIRLVFGIIIILTVFLIFKYCTYTLKETSSLFYIFSTIAQTIGAILGIISAMLVFTVASLESKRDSLKTTIIEAIKLIKSDKVINHLKLEEFIKTEKITKAMQDKDKYMDFIVVLSTYKGLRLYKEYILNEIKFPVILGALTIILSIIGLSLTEIIVNKNIGLIYGIAIIQFCIWTILEITYYIIKLPDIATSLELELDNILDEE